MLKAKPSQSAEAANAAKRVTYAHTIATVLFPMHRAATSRRTNAAKTLLKLTTKELRSLWQGAVKQL